MRRKKTQGEPQEGKSQDGSARSAQDREPWRGRILARSIDGVRIRPSIGGSETAPSDADVLVPLSVEGTAGLQPGDWVEVGYTGERYRYCRLLQAHGRWWKHRAGSGRTETQRMGNLRRHRLWQRTRVLAEVHQFFADEQFFPIEAPLMVPAPGLDLHIDAAEVSVGASPELGLGSGCGPRWLITSPEFQMKRLLVAGFERIYAICKCFRTGEHGLHHSEEFTMLEWYRAWADWRQILADTEVLVSRAVRAIQGSSRLQIGDEGSGEERFVDVSPPWPQLTVAQAMERYAGVTVRGGEDCATLGARMQGAGIDTGSAGTWDDLFYTAFVTRVEPALAGLPHPIVLIDWPAELAALARPKSDAPHLVERFEVYIAGLELCNAFGELTDPDEQARRFTADLAARAARGRARYPLDRSFLRALHEGMPPSAGIALGIDRLVMLATGARSISEVLPFARDEL